MTVIKEIMTAMPNPEKTDINRPEINGSENIFKVTALIHIKSGCLPSV